MKSWMQRYAHWLWAAGCLVAGLGLATLLHFVAPRPPKPPPYIPGTFCREFTTPTLRCVKCEGTSFAAGPVSCVPLDALP